MGRLLLAALAALLAGPPSDALQTTLPKFGMTVFPGQFKYHVWFKYPLFNSSGSLLNSRWALTDGRIFYNNGCWDRPEKGEAWAGIFHRETAARSPPQFKRTPQRLHGAPGTHGGQFFTFALVEFELRNAFPVNDYVGFVAVAGPSAFVNEDIPESTRLIVTGFSERSLGKNEPSAELAFTWLRARRSDACFNRDMHCAEPEDLPIHDQCLGDPGAGLIGGNTSLKLMGVLSSVRCTSEGAKYDFVPIVGEQLRNWIDQTAFDGKAHPQGRAASAREPPRAAGADPQLAALAQEIASKRRAKRPGMRIAAGIDPVDLQFPWAVGVFHDSTIRAYFASGTLVNPRLVLTSANVVEGKNPASIMLSVGGEGDFFQPTHMQIRRAKAIMINPHHNGTEESNLALIQANTPFFPETPWVVPIDLPSAHHVILSLRGQETVTRLMMVGVGILNLNPSLNRPNVEGQPNLSFAEIIAEPHCRSIPRNVCAQPADWVTGGAPREGDAGAAFVCDPQKYFPTVCGVLSDHFDTYQGAALNKTAMVVTPLYKYVLWIEEAARNVTAQDSA